MCVWTRNLFRYARIQPRDQIIPKDNLRVYIYTCNTFLCNIIYIRTQFFMKLSYDNYDKKNIPVYKCTLYVVQNVAREWVEK